MDTKNKNLHFIAIGGVGQSALAKILKIKGYNVSGSDIKESKYTKELRDLGVQINIGHDKNVIKENMTIVLSSAIKEDNEELIRAKELNLPLYHRSDILKLISELYDCFIGFSGTHGKTTTSGLCSYVLEKINAHPAYASGGIIQGLNTNANSYPDSKIFIAELDESDGTIIKYSPDFIAINNLEADHFDFYKNGEEDLINTFKTFIDNLKQSSKIFINIDDEGNNLLIKKVSDKNIITYSIKNKNADYFADNIKISGENSFDLYVKGKYITEIKTQLTGFHNVINALCVISVLNEKGFNINDIKPYLYSFSGMKRRYEKVFENENVTVIDDYAHHPTEIKALLENAKKRTDKNIVAIFQPHRYTRLKALWNDFLNSFDLADELFILDTYSAGDKYDEKYNSKNFASSIHHKCAKYIKGNMDDAAREISKYIKKNDYIITIGAGDVTNTGYILKEVL